MNQIEIFIDADGCPVKDEVYRVAQRHRCKVWVVANKRINTPANAPIEMKVVSGDRGSSRASSSSCSSRSAGPWPVPSGSRGRARSRRAC